MTREEALEIAAEYGLVPQVSFFMTFLGFTPKEALIKVGIL